MRWYSSGSFYYCLYHINIFVLYFCRNFAYRNLLTGDNCTPLTRMNVISVVLKSIRDRAYTQGILVDRVPKDKIKYFLCWKLNRVANNIVCSCEDFELKYCFRSECTFCHEIKMLWYISSSTTTWCKLCTQASRSSRPCGREKSPWNSHISPEICGSFYALEGETLTTVTSFAHVRKYNTEIVVGLGHVFHAWLLLLWLRLLMLLRHWVIRILGHLQSRMILLHGMTDRDVRATSVLVALLIVNNALRIRYV